jgi:mono/diheme cytochrome c family protein
VKPFQLAIAASFVFSTLIAVSAQEPDATLTTNPVYLKNCAKCHGKTAEGRHFGGPSLISEKTVMSSADDLRGIITNGKGHMPKYTGKLTPEEIDTLVRQIKSTKLTLD